MGKKNNNGKNKSDKKFLIDFRVSNPALHLLYVKWAVPGLTALEQAQKLLEEQDPISTLDAQIALQNCKAKLICEHSAYADAWEILRLARGEIKKHEMT